MSNSRSAPPRIWILAAIAAAAAAIAVFVAVRTPASLTPPPETYEEVTRAFYRGLAALEVGLLDDARREFTDAAGLVPEEPASWANLGIAQLRLGELDAAAEPVGRALMLAPDHPDLALLAGRMEIARGRLDEGLAHLRRAVELDPSGLRARFALADEVERAAGPDADAQALALLDELARLAPGNAAVQVERARLAAKARNAATLADAIEQLRPMAAPWPERATEQFRALEAAAAAGDLQRAQLATTFLRNVLTSVPSFIESLSRVRTPTEQIAEPLDRFVAMPPPSPSPAPPDLSLTFAGERPGPVSAVPGALLALYGMEGAPALIAFDDRGFRRAGSGTVEWPLPAGASGVAAIALDWNNDFLTDVVAVWRGGIHLLLGTGDGGFADATAAAGPVTCDCVAVWAADVEMDGDLDIVAAPAAGDPLVLRNNGNGTWTAQTMFAGVPGPRAFAWADLDRDADPDAAFVDANGALHVFRNRQAGDFVRMEGEAGGGLVALTAADTDGDSVFELVALTREGAVLRIVRDGEDWETSQAAEWAGIDAPQPGSHRLLAADLDNNGALDLIASGDGESRIWMADEAYRFTGLQATPEGEAFAAADMNADGRLDLLATAAGGPVVHQNRGTRPYHWKAIRPRAQANAGDQRINSFGVGGDIEVRSGLLVQKHLLSGAPIHVGLGEQTAIDVARIVWPNGVAQAEFGVDVDDTFVAEQRLKGSCPWVFAWDGSQMAFVTDFLWRSPLGLRINAQDTAGVAQTEDWVRITGDQLAPRDGAYDLRITAELWETHFFDHVALLVVDHPAGTDVFVDERFSPASPPQLALHAVSALRPVARAWDHRGRDVTGVVARRDGQYLAAFDRGQYQGIGEDHFVEFELGADAQTGGPLRLLASGWIYPTDSSINVAIGQGGHVTPKGLSLDAQDTSGRWRVIHADLGFPAGKNKTIVVDLTEAAGARRLRLRTNLEIYWDSLAVASPSDAPLTTARLQAAGADLRFRGFSETTSPRGEAPETPEYDRIATRAQRWRDLTGYHTRFGDVRELVAQVDDRYVIMNAGDELHLRFPEQPPPPAGWTRDFVLIGDGWEKDGDYNTGFSQTVLPLPSHDRPDYGHGVTSLALEDDPVYQRHQDDWVRYHTRYVTPERFVSGLATTKR